MGENLDNTTLRVINIMPGTSVDGPGLRTSIYFAGCTHHCDGCHNPQSWDPHAGRDMTIAEIVDIVEENGFNVTFSGGDPLMQIDALTILAQELRRRGYSIWCYTGYTFEALMNHPELYLPLLNELEVLVDSPFLLPLRDIHLRFRGSSNQRLIAVPQTLASGNITLWTD